MNKTGMKIALLAGTMISVSVYYSVLAHAPKLRLERIGRIGDARIGWVGSRARR